MCNLCKLSQYGDGYGASYGDGYGPDYGDSNGYGEG